MFRATILFFAALLLAGCNNSSEEIVAAAMAEGDWGWGNGAGCDGLADVVRVGDRHIQFVRGDRLQLAATIVSRELNTSDDADDESDDGPAHPDRAVWIYDFTGPDGETLERKDIYTLSVSPLGFGALVFAERYERAGGGDFRRIVGDRRVGSHLKPCS